MVFFILPSIASSEAWSLTTLFLPKMRGKETKSQEHHLCPILLEFHPPLPSVKTIKNLVLSIQDTYIDQELCIFLIQLPETVSVLCNNCELVRTIYLVGLL